MAYSNVGYLFVREAIEEATSLDLGAALQRYVFHPLNLPSVRLAVATADFQELYWPSGKVYDPGWVYHGCVIGMPVEAAMLLNALFRGQIVRSETLSAILERREIGGAIAGRPWSSCGYSLGVMLGRMGEVGRAIGHSGGGPFCVNAVYHFPDLRRPITAAAFTDGGLGRGP